MENNISENFSLTFINREIEVDKLTGYVSQGMGGISVFTDPALAEAMSDLSSTENFNKWLSMKGFCLFHVTFDDGQTYALEFFTSDAINRVVESNASDFTAGRFFISNGIITKELEISKIHEIVKEINNSKAYLYLKPLEQIPDDFDSKHGGIKKPQNFSF